MIIKFFKDHASPSTFNFCYLTSLVNSASPFQLQILPLADAACGVNGRSGNTVQVVLINI
jgi:hypothetical protein